MTSHARMLRLEHETGIVGLHDDSEGCVLCIQKRAYDAQVAAGSDISGTP